MLRLALLAFLGIGIGLRAPVCSQEESEPNGTISTATTANVTLPAFPAVTLCGAASMSDNDFWKVPLLYPTSMMCEGRGRFTLDAGAPVSLTVLSATDWNGQAGYSLVGRWDSQAGHVDTGELGILYYWAGFNHCMVLVEVHSPGQTPYRLAYW